jgi:nucleotide-binding universal stress UspA family protein
LYRSTAPRARALPVAKQLAAHFGGRLHLLQVVPPTVDRNHLQYIAAPDALDAEDVAVHAAHRHLQHVGASLRGTPVACEVRIGQPADAIRKAAEDDACDLICMAAGGTGERVTRQARVPVLLVRPAR